MSSIKRTRRDRRQYPDRTKGWSSLNKNSKHDKFDIFIFIFRANSWEDNKPING